MTVRSPSGEYDFIDFRERAPAAAFQDMYKNNTNASLYGGLASGIPGELRGLEYLHRNYGRLPWSALVEPSIILAREGFEINEDFVRYMNATKPSNAFLYENRSWATDFAPNGTLLGVGDVMTRKRYADTLETIAESGPGAFYCGSIASATISAVQRSGGIMKLSDMSNYSIKSREPLTIDYRGFKLTSTSAPSSGAVVLAVLKAIEGYDMANPQHLNLALHLLDETIKFGYGEVRVVFPLKFIGLLIRLPRGLS
jgi:gamma-glutamyltranspeptidase / glutathione hydrolase